MSSVELSQLKCPQCGAPVDLHSIKTKAVSCAKCGALFDPKTQAVLSALGRPADFPAFSFLSLGLTGTIEKKSYQIIGRIRYRSALREWDQEDRQYYNESWVSDEWHLAGERGDMLFIYEDTEGYELSRPFVPTQPNIPAPDQEFLTLDEGSNARIQEFSDSIPLFFEGEFTWRPELGERVVSAEYQRSTTKYSVSRRVSASNEDLEVEFYESEVVTREKLAEIFQVREELDRLALEKRLQAETGWMAKLFFILAGVLVLAALFVGSSGRRIFQQEFSLAVLNEDEGVVTEAFNLTKTGRIYNLQLDAKIPDNSEAWAAVELLEDDEDDSAVNEFEGDFWRESGVDDEGSWSEGDTTTNNYFRLSEPGQFRIRVLGNPGTKGGTVSVSMIEGVTLSRYFLLAALLSGLYGAGIYRKRSLNPFLVLLGVGLIFFFVIRYLRERSGDD